MALDEFKQRVLEEQLFNELKDKALVNSEVFKKKYKDIDIDHSRLYRRIVNYQVKKYGSTLDSSFVYKPSYNERMKYAKQKRDREYKRYK